MKRLVDLARAALPWLGSILLIILGVTFCNPRNDCVEDKTAKGMSSDQAYYACKGPAGGF